MSNGQEDKPGHEPDPPCGAKTRAEGQPPCKNKPHIPSRLGGNGRCKFHGGLNTGPTTQAGKDRVARNAVKHGRYAKAGSRYSEYLKSLHTDAEQAVWDDIPQDCDLTDEIRVGRLKVAHLMEQRQLCLAKMQRFFPNEAEMRTVTPPPTADELIDLQRRAALAGLYINKNYEVMSNGCTLKDWEQLEGQARDELRRLCVSQTLVNPNSRTKGNISLTIDVRGAVVDGDDDVPDLVDNQAESAAFRDAQDEPVDAADTDDVGLTGNATIDGVDP